MRGQRRCRIPSLETLWKVAQRAWGTGGREQEGPHWCGAGAGSTLAWGRGGVYTCLGQGRGLHLPGHLEAQGGFSGLHPEGVESTLLLGFWPYPYGPGVADDLMWVLMPRRMEDQPGAGLGEGLDLGGCSLNREK